MDFDNNGFLDFISTSGKITHVWCDFKYCIRKFTYKRIFQWNGISSTGIAQFTTFQNIFFLLFTESLNSNDDVCAFSGNDFNKMNLWQNLGAGQNGKTQEVCISGNSHEFWRHGGHVGALKRGNFIWIISFRKRVFYFFEKLSYHLTSSETQCTYPPRKTLWKKIPELRFCWAVV